MGDAMAGRLQEEMARSAEEQVEECERRKKSKKEEISINCSSPCMISKLAANDLIEMSKKAEVEETEDDMEVTTEEAAGKEEIEVEDDIMVTTETVELDDKKEEQEKEEEEEDIGGTEMVITEGPTQKIISD